MNSVAKLVFVSVVSGLIVYAITSRIAAATEAERLNNRFAI